jgi:hypothetical protein
LKLTTELSQLAEKGAQRRSPSHYATFVLFPEVLIKFLKKILIFKAAKFAYQELFGISEEGAERIMKKR